MKLKHGLTALGAVAQAAAYRAGPGARDVTGQVLQVNGGTHLGG